MASFHSVIDISESDDDAQTTIEIYDSDEDAQPSNSTAFSTFRYTNNEVLDIPSSDDDRGASQTASAGTFPILSPLLPPRALSPVLASVNWNSERETTPLPLDPKKLCPYCDSEFPQAPSDTLVAMGRELSGISWPDPLPENALHRRVKYIRVTLDHCKRHRFELDHIQREIDGRWPLKPDFARLFCRVLKLGQHLRSLCKALDQSSFYLAAREYYGDKVAQLSSLSKQYASNNWSKCGAGL